MADSQGQKNRVKEFIHYLGITTKAFEESCGLSNGYVSSMRKGIGHKAIEQITESYPILNLSWLLTGEGEMLKSTSQGTYNKNIANTYGSDNQITQMSDLVIGGGISNIGNRSNWDTSTQNELEKRYKARIAEIEKNYESIISSKDEIIKELKNQIEQLNTMLKLLCDKR